MIAVGPGSGRRTVVAMALVIVILAIPLAVYLWGRRSDSFVVERITVSGQRRVPRREAERLLADRYLGENLFGIKAADVRQVLSVFPYVADVAIDRDYPDTLRVRISEYRPAALLLADGAWYVLSTEGRVVARLGSPPASSGAGTGTTPSTAASGRPVKPSPKSSSPSPSAGTEAGATARPRRVGPIPVPPNRLVPGDLKGLPIIATDAAVAVGDDVADPHVAEALDLIAALPAALRRDAAAVRVTDSVARLYLAPSLEVEFGAPDDLQIKVLALQAVLRRYRARGVRPTFVDVSVPDRPLGAPLLPAPRNP
jgi:cell division septal protein FtsQ